MFEFIAVRITELATAGDKAGVARWRQISERVGQLQGGTIQ